MNVWISFFLFLINMFVLVVIGRVKVIYEMFVR